MRSLNLINIWMLAFLLISCNGKDKNNSKNNEKSTSTVNSASVELTKLLREAYKQHIEKTIDDFPFKQKDSIYTGIDWMVIKEILRF